MRRSRGYLCRSWLSRDSRATTRDTPPFHCVKGRATRIRGWSGVWELGGVAAAGAADDELDGEVEFLGGEVGAAVEA